VDPRHADVTPSELGQLGALATAGRYAELEQSSRQLLTQRPGSGTLWKALAIALWMQGKDSLQALERATTLLPYDASMHCDRGSALVKLGKIDEAAACYRRAIAIDPGFVEALTYLGDILQQTGRHQEAVSCYERALLRRPAMPELHRALGQALQSLGRGGAAEASYRQALAWNPGYVEAHISLGKLLRLANRTTESLHCVQCALTLRPDDPDVLVAHAELLYGMGDYRAAVAQFRQALEVDRAHAAARIGAVVAEIAPCPLSLAESAASCATYARALAELEIELDLKPCTDAAALVGAYRPFLLAYRGEEDCELMRTYGRVCTTLMRQWQHSAGILISTRTYSSPSRLRVGIVSEYIRNHSVYNAITQGWLRGLDRKRFAIDVFCLDARADAQTNAARAMADHFEQGDRTLHQWARAIVDRQPDVLIYPEVGMNPTTVQLASMRLANTQMVSWGHPVTSGLSTLDYYLSAAAFEPPESAPQYTEELITLPNFGIFYERPAYPIPVAATMGSPRNKAPVLVCAGTPFKYSPEHDHVLVDIARRLGRCQFQFFNFEDGALSQRLLRRLTDAFAAAGLDGSEFLVLQPWASTQQFHDALKSADLLLDTIGFSGFNTVMHALECGLPVVTVQGRSLRGRLGSGILQRLSLADLVADSPRSYVDMAVSLLQDDAARARLRDRIGNELPKAYQDQSAIDALETLLLRVGEAAPRGMHRGECQG
jgi:predicted O-linked N-acetylglucosamine transferase (SPINDLY family)